MADDRTPPADLSDIESDLEGEVEEAPEAAATVEKVKPLRMKISKAKERALMKEFGLDETVLFKPLGHAQIAAIVRLQLEDLRSRMQEQELALDIDDEAIAWLADKGFDPVYGARPVKRALQRELETPVARKIVAGDYAPGATVRVTVSGGALRIA